MKLCPVLLLLLGVLVLPSVSRADNSTGRIRGRAVAAGEAPAAGAEVRLAGSSRRVVAAADGRFQFEGLPPGRYVVEAQSSRFGRGVETVELAAGADVEITIELDRSVHGEEVLVTASPDARSAEDLVRPASVLAGAELLAALEPSLGETLSREPGVNSTYFGPGASRPIIRGLGGDRIRVLTGGLGSGDVSTTSPDHAVAVDGLSSERIEIVRGPATLLYGSSAVGGVINVLDGSIPDFLPEAPVTGELTLRYGSNSEERAGAISLTGALGRLAWHVDGLRRETDDFEIPGRAELEGEEEEEHEEGAGEEEVVGLLPNSAIESDGAKVGLSWVGDQGFLGISASGYDTLYGIPGHAHQHEGEEHEEEAEAALRIDLRQRRLDLRGETHREIGIFRGLKVRIGSYDYEHRELEGEETGTLFLTEGWEARLEARHRPFGPLTGALGLQASEREFEAIGEEAFVPANSSRGWALFAFEEIAADDLTWQLGARFEDQEVAVRATELPDRSFSGVSASLGMVWKAAESLSTSVSIARSVTIPNPEALYSNGPHLATRTFEIGDPALDEEVSLGLDAGVHLGGERVHAELSAFVNRVDDFILESFTGEEEDDLPVVRFSQADVEFVGAEAELHLGLWHSEPHHLDLDLSADFVRAELEESGEPLPRIPALRFGAGLRYQGEAWNGGFEVRRIGKQDRLAPFETETSGYTLIGATVGYRFFLGATVHDLLLSGTNLGDEEARVHASFLKDLAPLPGRDLRLTYRLSF